MWVRQDNSFKRHMVPWQGSASPGSLKLCFGRLVIGESDFGQAYWIVDDAGKVVAAERATCVSRDLFTWRLRWRGERALAKALRGPVGAPIPTVEVVVDEAARIRGLERQLGLAD